MLWERRDVSFKPTKVDSNPSIRIGGFICFEIFTARLENKIKRFHWLLPKTQISLYLSQGLSALSIQKRNERMDMGLSFGHGQ